DLFAGDVPGGAEPAQRLAIGRRPRAEAEDARDFGAFGSQGRFDGMTTEDHDLVRAAPEPRLHPAGNMRDQPAGGQPVRAAASRSQGAAGATGRRGRRTPDPVGAASAWPASASTRTGGPRTPPRTASANRAAEGASGEIDATIQSTADDA